MGWGKILGAIGAVVSIAAAVASGGALAWLAAGMLTLNVATSAGLIGGSIGKFVQSGAGRALTLAAGAAAAYGAFTAGAGAADVGAAESAQSANAASQTASTVSQSAADSAAAGGAEAAQGAAAAPSAVASSANDMITPPNVAGSAAGAGTNQAAWNMSGPPLNSASGVNGASMAQVSESETQAVQQASQVQGFNNASVAGASTTGNNAGLAPGPAQAQSAVQTVPENTSMQPGGYTTNNPAGGAAPGMTPADVTATNQSGAAADQMAGSSNSGGGGFVNAVLNTKGGAGLLQGAAGAVGGIGQGIMQKQTMEDQIKAMQWANMQWENQSQVGNVNNAAAQPINVPGGYLQRAQAIRNMVSTNPFVPPAPTPVPGAPAQPKVA